jgi:HTH-type transcriptional regulator / antitoxin HigA
MGAFYLLWMRVIARRTLREFVESRAGSRDQPALKAALDAWFVEVRKARWSSTVDVKRLYASASIVSGDRIVFNIRGNAYRLVVAVDFEKGGWARIATTTVLTLRRSMLAEIRPIRTEADYENALAEVERLWGARLGTPEGDRLDVLATLIDAYESEHHPIDPPDPIEAIKFRMEQQGLTRRDLEGILGSRTRVAEVLNRRRSLSINMMRRLQDKLGISAEVLIRPCRAPIQPIVSKMKTIPAIRQVVCDMASTQLLPDRT